MPEQTIGRYQIQGELGRGPAGELFRAFDPLHEKEVAIELVEPPPAAKNAERADYQRRIVAAAHEAEPLRHPNIVDVYAAGVTPEGATFIVTELCEGSSLEQLLRSGGPLSARQASRAGEGLARALECAHEAGIAHGAVNPFNALRTADGVYKLQDFAIARIALTRPGDELPIPALEYLSPEQIRDGATTRASDLFSLGLTVYTLLTGTHPFARTLRPDTERAVLEEMPPPPSSLRPELPSDWDRLLAKAMAKRPEDRFRDAGTMALAFAGVEATPLTLEPPSGEAIGELELIVVEGPDAGLTKLLGSGVKIGRNHGDLELNDATVSSHHCEVTLLGGRIFLTDRGSRNGTWIDGERVEHRELALGNTFFVGSNTLVALGRRGQEKGRTLLDADSAQVMAAVSEADDSAPYLLRIREGPTAGRLYPLVRSAILGRDEGDVQLDDPRVSRKHAVVEVQRGKQFLLRDLASSNGTWYRGKRVGEVELVPGDEFCVGSSIIVLEKRGRRPRI